MKYLFVFFLLATSPGSFAQSNQEPESNYDSLMSNNIRVLDTAVDPATLLLLADNFEKIANTQTTLWLPSYYAALCYVSFAMQIKDAGQKDIYADKAELLLQKSEGFAKANSEISAVRAMLLFLRISADPGARWTKLSTEAFDYIALAKLQDTTNPRPYLIDAITKLKLPKSMGGGKKMAQAALEVALIKFQSFVPFGAFYPRWGQAQAIKVLDQLKN